MMKPYWMRALLFDPVRSFVSSFAPDSQSLCLSTVLAHVAALDDLHVQRVCLGWLGQSQKRILLLNRHSLDHYCLMGLWD